MSAPFQRHHRYRQRQADPESAREVDQFGIGAGVGGGHLRLQRHAADRAGAGSDLADLGMHRAGVDGAFDHRLRRARAEIFFRIGHELGAAAGGAEIIGGAFVIGLVLGTRRIDAHAADRIECAGGGRRVGMIVVVVRRLGVCGARQIFLGIGGELGAAAAAAEIIAGAVVVGGVLGGGGIDAHAADRIGGTAGRRGVRRMVVGAGGGVAHGDALCQGLYSIPVGGI